MLLESKLPSSAPRTAVTVCLKSMTKITFTFPLRERLSVNENRTLETRDESTYEMLLYRIWLIDLPLTEARSSKLCSCSLFSESCQYGIANSY